MNSISIDEDDHTLSILPTEKGPKEFKLEIEHVTFLILSGEDKEKEITFNVKEMHKSVGNNAHLATLKNVFEIKGEFYFKPEVKILCKTAN